MTKKATWQSQKTEWPICHIANHPRAIVVYRMTGAHLLMYIVKLYHVKKHSLGVAQYLRTIAQADVVAFDFYIPYIAKSLNKLQVKS